MESIPLTADFKDFLELLNSEKVEFLIIGAYAVSHHGYVRSTGDMDIWVKRSRENAERMLRVLRRFGFSESSVSVEMLLGDRRIFQIGIIPFRIDIFTRVMGVEFDVCYARRVKGNFDGVLVDVIGLDDLKANKKASGRKKDLGDLEALE